MITELLHPSTYAVHSPDKPAWIMAATGELVTYRVLEDTSNRFAQLLRARGLDVGAGVVVLLPNHCDLLHVYWGAHRAGMHFTPISTQFATPEIGYVLSDCDAQVFVTCSGQLPKLAGLDKELAGIPHKFLLDGSDPRFENWRAAISEYPTSPIADDGEGADMLYSSGTTGQPKGVRNAKPGNAIGTVSNLFRRRLEWHHMDVSTVYLSCAPLYHSAPLRYSTMTMRVGGTAVILDRFDPENALAVIERYRITHSQWVPTMLVRLLRLDESVRRRYDLSSHRFAVHAAAPCPIPIKEQMFAWWGPMIYEYYSGTEGNGQTAIGPEEWLRHKGSVGKAIHGILHIVGEDGRECAPYETGKVYFENGSDFAYYKDPDKTAQARNASGWTTLGDIGHVDDEGYLYLTDRESFMIISGGVNIYPQEVENVLVAHAAVVDAAVFGIPDAEFGEQVKAAVELTPGIVANDALTEELLQWCRTRLAHLKCPKSIDFHAKLPRHDTGKLYKKPLKDAYWPARSRAQ